MRKYHILGLTFLTLIASGAILATTAFAEEEKAGEWLDNGKALAAEQGVTTSMEFTLEETKIPVLEKAKILCSALFVGTVGIGADDLITAMLDLDGEPVSEQPGEGLICEAKESCQAGTDNELWPSKLPWETLLTQMASGAFLDLIHPIFIMLCLVPVFEEIEVLCEGLTSSELLVVAGGFIEPMFSAAAGTEKLECSIGGENSGTFTSIASQTALTSGEPLTVSE
jgi:hypothetical protein